MLHRQAPFFWGIMMCPLLVASKYRQIKTSPSCSYRVKRSWNICSQLSHCQRQYTCADLENTFLRSSSIDHVTDLHNRHNKHYGDIFLLDAVIGMNQIELLDALYPCVWSVFHFKGGHIGSSWLDCRLLQTLTTSWQYWHPHKSHLTLHSFFDASWMRSQRHECSHSTLLRKFLHGRCHCTDKTDMGVGTFQGDSVACPYSHFVRNN